MQRLLMSQVPCTPGDAVLFTQQNIKSAQTNKTYGAFSITDTFINSDLVKTCPRPLSALTLDTIAKIPLAQLKQFAIPYHKWTASGLEVIKEKSHNAWRDVCTGMWSIMYKHIKILHPGYHKLKVVGDFGVKYFCIAPKLHTYTHKLSATKLHTEIFYSSKRCKWKRQEISDN